MAALFVQTNGVYFGLEGVDPWDEARDARNYTGPWPVIAHPPCERWSQLAHIHKHKPGKAIGDDGGCFESALQSVRLYGGILEHPAGSVAWARFRIPRPASAGWTWVNGHGGWTCEVEQGSYGHRAPKKTWLFAVVPEKPPELVWGASGASGRVDLMSGRGKERSRTPEPFRDLLLTIARSCYAEVKAA